MKASSSGVIVKTSSHLPFEEASGMPAGGAWSFPDETSMPLEPSLLREKVSDAEAVSEAFELACKVSAS